MKDQNTKRRKGSALGLGAPFAGAASEVIPLRWKNCTQVNKRYPHGWASWVHGTGRVARLYEHSDAATSSTGQR
jgi:hypothetical protein